jgi:hypothetical protein
MLTYIIAALKAKQNQPKPPKLNSFSFPVQERSVPQPNPNKER